MLSKDIESANSFIKGVWKRGDENHPGVLSEFTSFEEELTQVETELFGIFAQETEALLKLKAVHKEESIKNILEANEKETLIEVKPELKVLVGTPEVSLF